MRTTFRQNAFDMEDAAASTKAFSRNKKRFFSCSKTSFFLLQNSLMMMEAMAMMRMRTTFLQIAFKCGRCSCEHEIFLQEQEAFLQLLQGFIFPASEQSDDDGSGSDDEDEDDVSAERFQYGRRGREHESFLQEQEA
jgi:hypothetical protein